MNSTWILPQCLAVGPTPLSYTDLQSLAYQRIKMVITLTESSLYRFVDITPLGVKYLNLYLLHYGFPDQTTPPIILWLIKSLPQ